MQSSEVVTTTCLHWKLYIVSNNRKFSGFHKICPKVNIHIDTHMNIHTDNNTVRPDGINFVFPVSRLTLQKSPDLKLLFQKKKIFLILPQRCISGTFIQQMFFQVLNTSIETFSILAYIYFSNKKKFLRPNFFLASRNRKHKIYTWRKPKK